MGNSLLCKPYDAVIGTAMTAATSGSTANLLNDEPGLIYVGPTNAVCSMAIDLGSAKSVKALVILGLVPNGATVTVQGANTTDFSSTVYTQAGVNLQMSTSRSDSYAKFFYYIPAGVTARYWRVYFPAVAGYAVRAWRFLACDAIQPSEGISVGAEEGIDDRSVRRYARNGRRVIDPTVICPTFQGVWPWLTEAEAKGWFKPFIRGNGATKPAMFVLDPDDTTYGEDGIIYGDLEKANKLGYEDGCYSFSLAIVGIAA